MSLPKYINLNIVLQLVRSFNLEASLKNISSMQWVLGDFTPGTNLPTHINIEISQNLFQ